MNFFVNYVGPRLVQWLLVVFFGVTITFLIPRLSPINPVDVALNRALAFQEMSPEGVIELRKSLQDLYGLDGTITDQYINFWKRIVVWDLGPSFSSFPMTVNEIINSSLHWTVGLLSISIILSWIIGLILGTWCGYYENRWWSKLLENFFILIYPIPYYVVAFVLLMFFAFYLPIFPLVGGAKGDPAFTLKYLFSVIEHGFLPAISVIITAVSLRFIFAKALTKIEVRSDYVEFAKLASIPDRKIINKYAMKNTMLPQITDLGFSLATIFEGALITEVVFSYPGLGYTIYRAIVSADYNLIMGITILSIIGIATISLIIDLTYPLFDPRIKLK